MSDIADKPGVYKNFTGEIKFDFTDCIVKKANFKIQEEHIKYKNKTNIFIFFFGGDVVHGNLWNAYIENCNFYGDTLIGSVFKDGTFDGKHFISSYWLGGNWHGGSWDANNYDKFSRYRFSPPTLWDDAIVAKGTVTQPGRYKKVNGWVKYEKSNFYIKNGELEVRDKGRHRISIDDGIIISGNLCGAIINYVEFNGDKVEDSWWKSGNFNGKSFGGVHSLWEGGTFNGESRIDGIWRGGTFKKGTWENGTWYSGFDKFGNYHDEDDSPNKWNL